MPERPTKRPTKRPTRRSRPEPPPPLVDPEVVAKVRRGTARAGRVVAEVSARVGGTAWSVGSRGAVRAASWLWPRLKRGAVAAARALARALAWSAKWCWGERKGIARASHRVLWWGALAILVLVGRALLSSHDDPELLASATFWFASGLAMSVLVLLGAPETRMRIGAVALAGGHGAACVLAWLVL